MRPLLLSMFARAARRSYGTPAPAPGPAPAFAPLKIAANVGSYNDYTEDADAILLTDLFKASRGFTSSADPSNTQAVVDANGFPTSDFGICLPRIPTQAFIQVFKCRIGATFSSHTIGGGGGAYATITNKVVTSGVTTFDINWAAGSPSNTQATIVFNGTARPTSGGGCTEFRVRSHGITINDPAVLMPAAAAFLSQFTRLRYMDPQIINGDLYTITPADRPSDTRFVSAGRVAPGRPRMSIEDAVRATTEANTNLWWCVPVTADDALMTEFLTVAKTLMPSGKDSLFELGNENWNASFKQLLYCVSKGLELVNGYSFQYALGPEIVSAVRASNVMTTTTRKAHGALVGDLVWVYHGSGAVEGLRTVVSVPTTTTMTYADTGSNATLDVANSFFRAGRFLASASRTSNVITMQFGMDHGITNGATVRVQSVGGLTGAVVATVTGARTITVPHTGADGAITLGGGSSIVADFTGPLNSYDSSYDQFQLGRRWQMRRTIQMAVIAQTVYGADFGTKVKIGYFGQPANDCADELRYVVQAHGTPSSFLYCIGHGTYFFFDASPWGGPNLRSVSTYGGNTPPLVSDYVAALATTGAGSFQRDNYDNIAISAKLYGLKLLQYEFGPDVTGVPPNSISAPAISNKMQSLFDASFQPVYQAVLQKFQDFGYDEVAAYHAGVAPEVLSAPNEYNSWPLALTFTTPSVRTLAMAAQRLVPGAGPTRNLIAPTGTTDILLADWARAYIGQPNPDGDLLRFNVSCAAGGLYSLSLNYDATAAPRSVEMLVNGAHATDIVSSVNGTDKWSTPVNVTLDPGTNAITFAKISGGFVGNTMACVKIRFVKV